ncbi:hypothetical protein [Kribbella sp. CA-294648]|uniref:hypothetical protein n=1 Tax=Kribbella sp. CA-294648 TaxID=3239948 RepID=UPI003D8ACCA8
MLFCLRSSFSGKAVYRVFASGGQEAFFEARFSLITFRTNHYSVPSLLIGRLVPVLLNASDLVVFDGRTEDERLLATGGSRVEFDHYFEALIRKPGALPGATALEQARASGKFNPIHEAWWQTACAAHGDTAGTRDLIEILRLHRHITATTSSPAWPRH